MTSIKPNDRVVIALGPGRGQRATVCDIQPSKPSGSRTHVVADDGSEFWFQHHQHGALLLEDSPEGRAVRQAYEDSLGPIDLVADVAFAKGVAAERRSVDRRVAIDRLKRHAADDAVSALVDLAVSELTDPGVVGKPPGRVAPALRCLAELDSTDPIPVVSERMRRWFASSPERHLCGVFGVALVVRQNEQFLELLRELCAEAAEPGLVAARLKAGDERVYPDLAKLRVVEREGRCEFDVGDLSPLVATRILEALGERASAVVQLNLVRQGRVAYRGVDLGAWLAWPDLGRFRRMDLSAGFTGKTGVEAVISSSCVSSDLELLNVSACDIGMAGCTVLGKAKRLGSLGELGVDAGDYDRSKWTEKCLHALFPKKDGALGGLKRLSIAGWDVSSHAVRELFASGRAPALRTVVLSSETVHAD